MTTDTMIDVEQAAFILAKKFPGLARGKDYWVAHPVDELTLQQTKTAWIPIWEPTEAKCPTPDDLLAWWQECSTEYAEIDAAQNVRKTRDALLAQTDPLIEIAADTGNADLEAALRKYRRELRSVPEQKGFPFNVEWPARPTA